MESSTIEIPVEPALDAESLLRFFEARTVNGTEWVDGDTYSRTIRIGGDLGCLQLSISPSSLTARVWSPVGHSEDEVKKRLGRMFDLESDLADICTHLSRDPTMTALVRKRPGLRIPGGWDPFEIAIRTVMGQQVSVQAARLLNTRLVDRCGEAFHNSPIPELTRVFPTPQQVVDADLSNMGMPGARVAALKNVSQAVLEDPTLFEPLTTAEETVARLCKVKGIGEWSAQYIAMRACRQFDAFPAADAGILRNLADAEGKRPDPKDVLKRAEAWRPWRSYAAHHIWASDSDR